MSSTTEKIKERLTVDEVIGSYIHLIRAGQNFKANCPFHNEKSPSFFISPERASYYCFGCGEKGDIFSFVQKFEGVDFMGALKILADKAGIEIEKSFDPKKTEEQHQKERLYQLLESATIFFQKNLTQDAEALAYIRSRGLSTETLKEWRVGLSRNGWQTVHDHLKEKGYLVEEINQAGLIKRSDKGWYDRFRNRIMFPIFDPSGRVIGYSARIWQKKVAEIAGNKSVSADAEAKYINSPETPLFNKSATLYGFNKAKNNFRTDDFALLVEGQIDLLLCHQAGTKNTVASSGTALTEQHVQLIKRFTDNLVIAYDADTAGINAGLRAWALALKDGLHVSVVVLPVGEDPASLILKSKDEWTKVLAGRVHVIDFCIQAILQHAKTQKEKDDQVKEKVIPLIAGLPSSIDRARYVSKIASEIMVAEAVIWEEIKKIPTITSQLPQQTAQTVKVSSTTKKPDRSEKIISNLYGIYLMSKDDALGEEIKKVIGDEEWNILNLKYSDSAPRSELLFETEAYYGDSEQLSKKTKELMLNLEEDTLKNKFTATMYELTKAEKDGKTDRVGELLAICKELSEKLQALSHKKPKETI